MFSFIPNAVKRYRRDHPYTHPVLFFAVDCTDSLLQFAVLGLIGYAGYYSFERWTSNSETPAVATASVQPLVIQTEETAIDQNQLYQTALIEASSNSATKPAIGKLTVAPINRAEPNHLLDGKYALRWVESQPETGFTIQFGSSTDKAALIDFASEHLNKGAVIYPFKQTNSNRTMYGVASGLYDSIPSALRAIDNMSATLVAYEPWIRPMSKLQKQVASTAATMR